MQDVRCEHQCKQQWTELATDEYIIIMCCVLFPLCSFCSEECCFCFFFHWLPLEQYLVPFPLCNRAIRRIWLRRRYQALIHGFRNEKKLVPHSFFNHRDGLRSFGNLVLVGPLTDRPWPVHDEDKDDTMTPITKELVDRNRDLTLHESWAATATETDTVLFVCFICLFVCLVFV